MDCGSAEAETRAVEVEKKTLDPNFSWHFYEAQSWYLHRWFYVENVFIGGGSFRNEIIVGSTAAGLQVGVSET